LKFYKKSFCEIRNSHNNIFFSAGTKITIRGENLGVKPNDLIVVLICGGECSFEWQSKNKIVARTGINGVKGKGDVVVTTLSGGAGSSTVQFRTYMETIGPLKGDINTGFYSEKCNIFSFKQNLLCGSRNLRCSH
jgi:IPT/TIG domain